MAPDITKQEASEAVGREFKAGYPTGPSGSACQFETGRGAYLQIQITDNPDAWSPPRSKQALVGIGADAFVSRDGSDLTAGALLSHEIIVVWTAGGESSLDRAVDVLRKVVSRVWQ